MLPAMAFTQDISKGDVRCTKYNEKVGRTCNHKLFENVGGVISMISIKCPACGNISLITVAGKKKD